MEEIEEEPEISEDYTTGTYYVSQTNGTISIYTNEFTTCAVVYGADASIDLTADSITLKNISEGKLYVAAYTEEGVLQQLKSIDVTAESARSMSLLSLGIMATEDTHSIRAFIWENKNTLKPLCDYAEIFVEK